MKHIVIISPVSSGATGASAHLQFQLKALGRHRLTIIAPPSDPPLVGVRHISLFSGWATRNRSMFSYFGVALQELSYFTLPFILVFQKPDIVICHAGLLNRRTVLAPILGFAKILLRERTRWVADVRDNLLGRCHVDTIQQFDRVIACSMNVQKHLQVTFCVKSMLAPVAQAFNLPLPSARGGGTNYVLYAGRISFGKGVHWLLAAWELLSEEQKRGNTLKLVGLLKDSSGRIQKQIKKMHDVEMLPALPRSELWAMMSGASCCVNPSPNEGFPRVSLEAIALRRPVVLPACVPEFVASDPELVVYAGDVERLSELIREQIANPKSSRYELGLHEYTKASERYIGCVIEE